MAKKDWNPSWWTKDDTSTWDRVKEAMKRDWEQTKHDFSSKSGKELNQDVDDTIRQAAGKQKIPAPTTPNPPDTAKHSSTPGKPIAGGTIRDDEWARSEDAVRFGHGAARHYKTREWDENLEKDLQKDWTMEQGHASWDDVKTHVRHGFTGGRRTDKNV